MVRLLSGKGIQVLLLLAIIVFVGVPFIPFFRILIETWVSDTEFAYGMLIPFIVGIWIYRGRTELQTIPKHPWPPALLLVAGGCAFQVLASLSGTLLFSGLALAIILIGVSGFLSGRQYMAALAPALLFLTVMVPLPSFVLGMVGWKLQLEASSISAQLLELFGIPVYREGILLRLPNYALEVKQACSGLRSIFALLTLAVLIGMMGEKKWRNRALLVMVTPVLALVANTLRIVITGIFASRFGGFTIGEAAHTALGIAVFLVTVFGLLGFRKTLRWLDRTYA